MKSIERLLIPLFIGITGTAGSNPGSCPSWHILDCPVEETHGNEVVRCLQNEFDQEIEYYGNVTLNCKGKEPNVQTLECANITHVDSLLFLNCPLLNFKMDYFVRNRSVSSIIVKSNNGLRYPFSSEFRGLSTLTILKLRRIRTGGNFSVVFGENLKRMLTVSIKRHDIERLPFRPFTNLENLLTLEIMKGPLRKLTEDLLHNLRRLEILDVSYNRISHLDETLFRETEYIASVDFSHNRIRNISPRLFLDLNHLRYVSLKHNRITTLAREIVLNIRKRGLLIIDESVQYTTDDLALMDI